MKPTYLLPAVTALIGFSIAWIAKPSASQTPVPIQTEKDSEKTVEKRSPRPDSKPRPPTSQAPRPARTGEFPLTDLAEQGPKNREEAKMLRLTEALGLSIEQQGAIINLIENVQAKINPNVSAIEDLTVRGNEVEEELKKTLDSEQLEKFEALRVRERENRVEIRSQKLLTQAIQDIDLSEDQREQVLDRLRQKSRSDFQVIPASATLLLGESMLPTKGKELSLDGVLVTARLSEENPNLDPTAAFQQMMNQRKIETEANLNCFDGILTPGQMSQYHASLAEKNKQMEQVQQSIFSQPRK